MNQRKACFLSLACLLGVAAAEYRSILLSVLLAACALAWLRAIKEAYRGAAVRTLWTALFIVAAACGVWRSLWLASFRETYEAALTDHAPCMVQGEIYQKEEAEEENLYYLKNCVLRLHQREYSCNFILLYLKAETYSIGEILCVEGKTELFQTPANEGGYNEKAYYQSLHIDFKVNGSNVVSVHAKAHALREGLWRLKQKVKRGYLRAMPKADAGTLVAMTLGDKSEMDAGRKTMYQNAGISHFYSISGLHISLLGMALYHLIRKRGAGYAVSGALSAAALILYGELIGFSVSAARAIGMFLLLLYAKYRGRSYDRMTALSLLAAGFAVKWPGLLHHAGYLLSFGAVSGVLLAERLDAPLRKEQNSGRKEKRSKASYASKAWNGLRKALLVCFCIQLTTVPVLCCFFYEISVYAVCVNLIVLPCTGVLLGFGILGGILCCFAPFAGKLALYPCSLILSWFDAVCRGCMGLPNAVLITGTLAGPLVALWYGALLFFVFLRCRKVRMPFPVLFLPFCMLCVPSRPRALEVDVLDVGQGDAVFLSAFGDASVFIDGGSSSKKRVGTYCILPFLKYRGVRRIDYWFVSHCDADHINGLIEVIESGYAIQSLVVSSHMPEDAAWRELKRLARQRRISVFYMDAGDAIRGRNNDWSITCLAPAKKGAKEDRNGASLALLFQSEAGSGFFAGDIGREQESALAEANGLPEVDVYKASHHGSDFSNCKEILDRLKPEIAVVSCGRKNSYGHPGKEAMERLAATNAAIYETRRLGQIKIRFASLEAEVSSMLQYTHEND